MEGNSLAALELILVAGVVGWFFMQSRKK